MCVIRASGCRHLAACRRLPSRRCCSSRTRTSGCGSACWRSWCGTGAAAGARLALAQGPLLVHGAWRTAARLLQAQPFPRRAPHGTRIAIPCCLRHRRNEQLQVLSEHGPPAYGPVDLQGLLDDAASAVSGATCSSSLLAAQADAGEGRAAGCLAAWLPGQLGACGGSPGRQACGANLLRSDQISLGPCGRPAPFFPASTQLRAAAHSTLRLPSPQAASSRPAQSG